MKKLVVIISDRLSVLVRKGEVVERYYNPGNYFDEVHIIMLNDDKVEPENVKPMIGEGRLFLYNYPEPPYFFKKSLGWQPFLMKKWIRESINLIQKIQPNLIRCHGAHLNAFVALCAKKAMKIPYVISLHTNSDESLKVNSSFKEKIIAFFLRKIEIKSLRNCDLVMPVYQAIVPYLDKRNIKNHRVCYNVLNDANLLKKEDYQLSSPVRILSLGRQLKGKQPYHLISALKYFSNAVITLIGDGDYHEALVQHAEEEGVYSRTIFVKNLMNNEVCRSLKDYDILAIHTDYYELSKVMLEGLLAGLPLLLNYRSGLQVPELSDKICLRVEDSIEGYKNGLEHLICDHAFRERLGRNAYELSQKMWQPKHCEETYVSIYDGILKNYEKN